MKKTKVFLILSIVLSMFSINITLISASATDSVNPTAIVYCEMYKGKHRAVNQGQCNIFTTKNESRSIYNWGYYRCGCGTVLFCSGRPDSDGYKAGIPEYYIETNDSHRGKNKDWEIYQQPFSYILKTDLPIHYRNTPLVTYTFS